MGHLTAKREYQRLRERLDRLPVGAPGNTTIYEILKILYSPEEAELAAQLPLRLSSLGQISRKVGLPRNELRRRLEAMAAKGLVFDIHLGEKVRYMLTPTVVGFFEFSMMRIRPDVDQRRLAELYHHYMHDDGEFFSQFRSDTQTTPFRTVVHESTIPQDYTEVLDWERASSIISDAGRWGVSLCHCRHVAHHLDRECQRFPLESCLTIGPVVDYIVRNNLGRDIEREEALALAEKARTAGMVFLCDNVQQRPTFLCNCCGCCCEVLGGFKKFKPFGNTFSSNFEATVETSNCIGCKKCLKACPVDAVELIEQPHLVKGKKIKKLARIDREICLGCGVCALACESEALTMTTRPQRRIVPESTFARLLSIAIEQGKLHQLIFDPDDGLTAYSANVLLGAILKLPPAKQLLARDTLRSRFVGFLVQKMTRKSAAK